MTTGVYKRTKYHNDINRKSHLGIFPSEATKKKMSKTQKKLRTAHWAPRYYGKNHPNWKGGKPICIDCGQQLKTRNYKDVIRLRCKKCNEKYRVGPNCPSWIDGRSKDPMYNRLCLHKRRSYDVAPIKLEIIQLVYENNIKKYGKLTCYLCLKPIIFGNDCIEHKTPLSRGGNNKIPNLDIACRSCNCKKYNKTESEYKDGN